MVLDVCAVILSPVIFTLLAANHEKVEPIRLDVNVNPTDPPLEIVMLFTLVTIGTGLTVTLIDVVGLTHPN